MASEISVNNYNNNYIGDPSNDDYSNADPANYFKTINLRYFAAAPLRMNDEHVRFKELCLDNGNPEAHYIEGLLQYFLHNEIQTGLYHLRESAIGNNQNGAYLYGILKLALGRYFPGKKYLDKLQWREERSTSDQCWARIKNSLSELPVRMRRQYYVNMVNLMPRSSCDPDDTDELCDECYYYKRLNQFVNFAMNRE